MYNELSVIVLISEISGSIGAQIGGGFDGGKVSPAGNTKKLPD